MIKAMIFDLDGTLVQTEQLKALAYSQTINELFSEVVDEQDVLDTYRQVVGLSRREVAQSLLDRFNLEESVQPHMNSIGVTTPWQALAQLRIQRYEQMISDREFVRAHQWPHNRALLEEARLAQCKLGLATMSHCRQVMQILDHLELKNTFDFIATRDDVDRGKPDPEIYELVASELDTPPQDCLVVEDSLAGIKSARAAGMEVIAVTTPMTRSGVHAAGVLDKRWIVDDPARLPATVRQLVELHRHY